MLDYVALAIMITVIITLLYAVIAIRGAYSAASVRGIMGLLLAPRSHRARRSSPVLQADEPNHKGLCPQARALSNHNAAADRHCVHCGPPPANFPQWPSENTKFSQLFIRSRIRRMIAK